MKKCLFFVLSVMMTIGVSYAQATRFESRIAVVEFKAGAGVDQKDIEGISGMFNTYFSPKGYTIVERYQIDRVIKEQGFQSGQLTQEEMVQIGQILNVSHIVMGDVVLVQNEYNVDVRVVSVEGGEIIAKDGISFSRVSSYRETMKTLAERISSKVPEPVIVDVPVEVVERKDLVDKFMVEHRDYFDQENIPEVKRVLMELSDDVFNAFLVDNKLRKPSSVQTASIFGFLGLDRFMLGQVGLGILKIASTYFTLGSWWVVDMCTATYRARTYNYKYVVKVYEENNYILELREL